MVRLQDDQVQVVHLQDDQALVVHPQDDQVQVVRHQAAQVQVEEVFVEIRLYKLEFEKSVNMELMELFQVIVKLIVPLMKTVYLVNEI